VTLSSTIRSASRTPGTIRAVYGRPVTVVPEVLAARRLWDSGFQGEAVRVMPEGYPGVEPVCFVHSPMLADATVHVVEGHEFAIGTEQWQQRQAEEAFRRTQALLAQQAAEEAEERRRRRRRAAASLLLED
jgi:hypothetical protein